MKIKRSNFYCFSPPVMLATFLIESFLLIYTLVRYKMTALTRLTALLLGCLATFQLAEYYVCGGIGMDAATWSRVGYVAITLLPPLGLHVTQVLAGRKLNRLTVFAYATGIIWASLFAISTVVFSGYVCGGNYVIFRLKSPLGGMYFAYYYIWLFATMYVAVKASRYAKPRIRKALTSQVFGYMMFIVPTSIVNLLWPGTFSGIPSIMCGFAVTFAVTLVYGVMPVVKLRPAAARRLRLN
jgi:hypothetical protein